MIGSLAFAPGIPVPLLLLLTAFAIGLLIYGAWRRAMGFADGRLGDVWAARARGCACARVCVWAVCGVVAPCMW